MALIGGDIYKLAAIPRNTPCVIVAILNDAPQRHRLGVDHPHPVQRQ